VIDGDGDGDGDGDSGGDGDGGHNDFVFKLTTACELLL
jgi:hypothetical protein